jgi:hypothetical protein
MDHTNRESIIKLVSETKSFNEFILRLYGNQGGNSWRKGKKLVENLGIDTSHYKISKYTKDILEEIVKECDTIVGVCKLLKLKKGGGSQNWISKKIKEFGIDCTHFKKRQFPTPKKLHWSEVLAKRENGSRRSRDILRRCLMESGRQYQCESGNCTISENWLGAPITLQIHHLDGDCLNDSIDNLKFMCPNCHSQTSNWCAKNRGN